MAGMRSSMRSSTRNSRRSPGPRVMRKRRSMALRKRGSRAAPPSTSSLSLPSARWSISSCCTGLSVRFSTSYTVSTCRQKRAWMSVAAPGATSRPRASRNTMRCGGRFSVRSPSRFVTTTRDSLAYASTPHSAGFSGSMTHSPLKLPSTMTLTVPMSRLCGMMFCTTTAARQSPRPVNCTAGELEANRAAYSGRRAEECGRMVTGVRSAKVYSAAVSDANTSMNVLSSVSM